MVELRPLTIKVSSHFCQSSFPWEALGRSANERIVCSLPLPSLTAWGCKLAGVSNFFFSFPPVFFSSLPVEEEPAGIHRSSGNGNALASMQRKTCCPWPFFSIADVPWMGDLPKKNGRETCRL